jgi:diguanylate cyclase (GGDEF)-like protein
MRFALSVRHYCAGIFMAGCVALAALGSAADLGKITKQPATFAFLCIAVVLGELLPVKIPRRGNDEEIVLSTSFSVALLLVCGIGPALIAQGAASVIQDLWARKPFWRVRFNLGQYTLSMSAALIVIRMLGAGSRIGSSHPFTAAQLPAVLLGAAAFFIVNVGIVGIAVARYQDVPIARYFRNNAFFVVVTGCVLLFLAPIVIASVAYTPFLIPLFAAPMLAIYYAGRESSKSEHAARHDALTGLKNRAAFREIVTEAIQEDQRPACVLLMDLDRFKEVNDTLGHRYGDLLLQQVAGRVVKQMSDGDSIARLGGDEFAIFSQQPSAEAALNLADAVSESLRLPFELEQFVVDAPASVGVALFPSDGNDLETLLQRADVAMYRAKENHKNVALYDEQHDHHSPAKLALRADLRTAVDTDQIVVWYQPELDLVTDQVTAVEALVRWEHPDLGVLPPNAFLDTAERTNLITRLTQRVLELALKQVSDWNDLGFDLTIAVNVSARVLGDRDFNETVADALSVAGVPPERLKLEVTESTLMVDPELAKAVLRELSLLGVGVAIDDFGTGYSSLAYLADLPVSEVKIDRTFVSRMSIGSREGIIVTSTIDLAHHLHLRAVAEGVEDLTLLARLKNLGCDMAQGYGISAPLAPDDLTRWLLNRKQSSKVRPLITEVADPRRSRARAGGS